MRPQEHISKKPRCAEGWGRRGTIIIMIIADTYLPLFAQLSMYASSVAKLCRRRSFSPHFTDQEREADKELGQGSAAGNAELGLNPGMPCTATFPGGS